MTIANTVFMSVKVMETGFDLSAMRGLSEEEAAEKLKTDGPNELRSSRRLSNLSIILSVARQPMFLLLVGGGAIYLVLGDLAEAAMLLGFVFVVMGITIYQERKTEKALEALRDLSAPRALVIRGGKQKRIAGREVVRGDILVLGEGNRVPADAVLIDQLNLTLDESLLTGESVPVMKTASSGEKKMERPGGDRQPFVYAATLVVHGHGIAEVLAIGAETEIGRIGSALESVNTEDSPLQKESSRLVRNLAILALFISAAAAFLYWLTRGELLKALLAGVALAMSILPEEIPVILTVFLALGAWRLSQKRVLTRRVPAVEALGAATVLCVDKTGTITMNRMAVSQIIVGDKPHKVNAPAIGGDTSGAAPLLPVNGLPEEIHEAIEFGILASQKDPHDPMEKALRELGTDYLSGGHIHKDWELVREYPLSPKLLSLSHVWKSPDESEYVIAAKGAPEAIADLCHLNSEEISAVSRNTEMLANDGLRVLGIAKAYFQRSDLPPNQHDFDFAFVGLVGLADPMRTNVPAALQECYSAGIRVVMITGDYPGTAKSIARQAGLSAPDNFLTGSDLISMSMSELKEQTRKVDIFARMIPEQKLNLVQALKSNNEIVAMTGDGVNDAPALKAAHIGVAMGARGTDVAREAASLVLLDDDFDSIVQAVKLGRVIFENLKKAVAYTFAIHVPIIALSLLPIIFRWPLILFPVHIVFLELIIDPACSIVFEAEPPEDGIMQRPPRDSKEPLFSRRVIGFSLLQGAVVSLIVIAIFRTAIYLGHDEFDARAIAFTSLIVANLSLILTNRSWTRGLLQTMRTRNAPLWWLVAGTFCVIALVIYVPFLRRLFQFAPLHVDDLAFCLTAGLSSILWFEVAKVFFRKKNSLTGSTSKPG